MICRNFFQAAQYGLQVLEEKLELQERNGELERYLEATQQELEKAKHEFDLSTKVIFVIFTSHTSCLHLWGNENDLCHHRPVVFNLSCGALA